MSEETRERKREAELDQLSIAAYTASLCGGMAEIANLSGLPLLVYLLKMAKADPKMLLNAFLQKKIGLF